MGDYLNDINKLFPKRRTLKEKEGFREWAIKEANSLGYEAKVDAIGKHNNVVIGDIKTAKAVFTAHYDTPAMSLFPNIMIPRNIVMFFAYQFLGPILMVIAALWLAYLPLDYLSKNINIEPRSILMFTFIIIYYLMFIVFYKLFKNPNNINDNTSGVSAIYKLLSLINEENKDKVAFVLFDNEEKGKLGSKALFKREPNTFTNKIVVNMDCVANGNNIITIAKDEAMKLPEYKKLIASFNNTSEFNTYHYPLKGSESNSDYKSFPCGVGIMACKKAKLVGFYTPRIHTIFDTVADSKNIDYIAFNLNQFVINL